MRRSGTVKSMAYAVSNQAKRTKVPTMSFSFSDICHAGRTGHSHSSSGPSDLCQIVPEVPKAKTLSRLTTAG